MIELPLVAVITAAQPDEPHKICYTCKHWKIEDDESHWRLFPEDPDTFEKMKMPFEVRYCRHPRLMQFERPIEPDQASCMDGSEFRADLATGPEFGCVHHEFYVRENV